jgi:hypothetical protein
VKGAPGVVAGQMIARIAANIGSVDRSRKQADQEGARIRYR